MTLHYILPNCYLIHDCSSDAFKLTNKMYTAYQLHVRTIGFNTIHRCGRLFQEYCVDKFAQIEHERLSYFRTQDYLLRSERRRPLEDAAANGMDLANVGTRIVLPSSFSGGPRQMWQLYHDAMAIVRYCGKPDLFITMTANPNWDEITSALLPGQTAQDRPDLVARVFHLKFQELLALLTEKSIFGKHAGYVYTIEFQKRGLPHAHVLLILQAPYKPKNPTDYDRIVSAELPEKTLFPELYQTVTSCMLHGPCGSANPNAPCMKDGKCTKKYPRQFNEMTTSDGDGYPIYRRRDNGETFHKDRIDYEFTNRDVIPYNAYLSQMFNCHINVEIASSIGAVKYLYKYIYKGHDRTAMSIQQEEVMPVDEIQDYLDGRYVSASEACWRIFGFDMHGNFPSVERLPVHIEDGQNINYNPARETAAEVISRPDIDTTKLTVFFEACVQFPDLAAGLLYPDCPSKFVWKGKEKRWVPRQRGYTIGRVLFCPPSAGEQYYLRMLLYTVPAPTSWNYLRMFEGNLYPTFQAACAARGLLATDEEWHQCLEEASLIQTGHQLRQLFATILLNNSPLNPNDLLHKYMHNLSDDCRYRLQTSFSIDFPTQEQIKSLALHELNVFLHRAGKTLADYHLPIPSVDFSDLQGVPRIIAEERNYHRVDLKAKWEQGYLQANPEQKEILDCVTSALESDEGGGLFFIDGPGGTGKTFVENLILAQARSSGAIALSVASSGIAAILLDAGRTSHSRFKIPIDIHSESLCPISAQTDLAALLKETSLIVWDEAPAQHRHCFEAVDRTLKDLRNDSRWFGGITIVFGGTYHILCLTDFASTIGDFRQCLPVVQKGTRAQIVASTIAYAPFWKDVKVMPLKVNMRVLAQVPNMSPEEQIHSVAFTNWLLEVGNGTANGDNGISIKLPSGKNSQFFMFSYLFSQICVY
jgi:hypothetical protein